jgi:hypothetical protein
MKRILIASLLAAASSLAVAAPAPEALAERARVVAFLTYDCGTAEQAEAFRTAVLGAGPAGQPVYLLALTEGAPADIRAAEERRLTQAHEKLQAALQENGTALPAGNSGASLPPRETFVADGLRRLDVRFRENAIRGLGIVGNLEAETALRRVGDKSQDLKPLVAAAIAEITARHKQLERK